MKKSAWDVFLDSLYQHAAAKQSMQPYLLAFYVVCWAWAIDFSVHLQPHVASDLIFTITYWLGMLFITLLYFPTLLFYYRFLKGFRRGSNAASSPSEGGDEE